MGRKVGGCCVPFLGELGPHLTQCGLGRGLYVRTKWHLDTSSRLATTDMGRKSGSTVPFLGEELGPHLKQSNVACAEAYLHIKWHPNPSNRLATADMGPKLGAVPLWGSWLPL